MIYIPSFHECRSCDFVGEEPFTICPLCSVEAVRLKQGTDFQNGFRFAMRLMEKVGHRIDTKELFDTLTDVGMGIQSIETATAHSAETNQACALRMLRVIEEEHRERGTLRSKILAAEKVPAYA